MALYNEILVGRYNRALQKIFGIKGSPPAAQLGGELTPAISMFYGVENRFAEGWHRFGVNVNVAGIVGQFGAIRWRNPSNSGVIAVFERILLNNQSGAAVNWNMMNGQASADLSSVFGTVQPRLDSRGNQNPAIIGSVNTGAPSSLPNVGTAFVGIPIGASFDLIGYENQEVPLVPGDAIQLETTVANQQLTVTFWWRERPIEDSEKQ